MLLAVSANLSTPRRIWPSLSGLSGVSRSSVVANWFLRTRKSRVLMARPRRVRADCGRPRPIMVASAQGKRVGKAARAGCVKLELCQIRPAADRLGAGGIYQGAHLQ